MDYRYLKQQLMKTFQQLVIFDIKEVKLVEIRPLMDKAVVYDLTDQTNEKLNRKYYMGSYNYTPMIIILEDYSRQGVEDHYQEYLTTIYNLYGAIVKHQTRMTPYEEMEFLSNELSESDQQIHWIWFREKEFYLPNKIMSRAKSWIELNPSFKIYLWTNLIDRSELEDFISELNEDNRQYFIKEQIIVKYQEDILTSIEQFYDRLDHKSEMTENVLQHLFNSHPPVTTTSTNTISTSTHTTLTTIITTQTQNNYKINRIFRVDLLRIILLNLYGGIYCDFNDTICFYPMKYLLTMYQGQYFLGTDYDTEHTIFRNNYFIYNSLNNKEFLDISIKCINKAVNEYVRITSPTYIHQYYELCLEFLVLLNQTIQTIQTDIFLIPMLLQLEKIKTIIDEDKLKEPGRIINLIAEILGYFGSRFPIFKQLSQRIIQELDAIDVNCLRSYVVRQKMGRRRRHILNEIMLPIVYEQEKLDTMVSTCEFYDYFLMKYAIIMTIGDLILSTNIAYIEEIKTLIPYSRSNRLSTISMITHVYDGTSYGLAKNYETISPIVNDLRREFL